jgi:hypothetical protein
LARCGEFALRVFAPLLLPRRVGGAVVDEEVGDVAWLASRAAGEIGEFGGGGGVVFYCFDEGNG